MIINQLELVCKMTLIKVLDPKRNGQLEDLLEEGNCGHTTLKI